jgi:hypothetical protein
MCGVGNVAHFPLHPPLSSPASFCLGRQVSQAELDGMRLGSRFEGWLETTRSWHDGPVGSQEERWPSHRSVSVSRMNDECQQGRLGAAGVCGQERVKILCRGAGAVFGGMERTGVGLPPCCPHPAGWLGAHMGQAEHIWQQGGTLHGLLLFVKHMLAAPQHGHACPCTTHRSV